jgi:hypothetical protein
VTISIDIDAYLSELRITVVDAGLHYDIWSTLTNPNTVPKYHKDMHRYQLFFSTSIKANLVATLIALYCLYETNNKTYNINELCKEIHCRFTADSLKKIDEHYAKAKFLWGKVNILRNNVFGHRSTLLNIEAAFAKANVTPEDLRQLIEISKALLNEVSFLHDQSKQTFNLDARGDTVDLLEDLARVLKKPPRRRTSTLIAQ